MAQSPGLPYIIHTPRLILRCWHPTDASQLRRKINDNLEYLRAWMDWAQQEPESLEMKRERLRRFRDDFLSRREYIYGVFAPDGLRIIGETGLRIIGAGGSHTGESMDRFEMGYWIGQSHANNGLATESAAALTRVAFEVNRLERLEIRCDPRNKASARVAEKLGYIHRATLYRNKTDAEGRLRDTMVWRLDAKEYPDSRASEASVAVYNRGKDRIL